MAEAAINEETWLAELVSSATAVDLNNEAQEAATHDSGRIVKVTEEMYITGSIDDSIVDEIKKAGIKSVFNLRNPKEPGYVDFTNLPDGIPSSHHPLDSKALTDAHFDTLLGEIDKAPKPTLVYCETGGHAAAVSVAHSATRSRFRDGSLPDDKLSPEQHALLERVNSGADLDEESQMKKFVQSYIGSKVSGIMSRPGTTVLHEDVFVTGQLSEKEFKEMREGKGIKSVLNLRPPEEAGQFGLGVLAREEEIVTGLGMVYKQVPVPKDGPYSAELTATVLEQVMVLDRPLLIHCRTGRRVQAILAGAAAMAVPAKKPE